MHVALTTFKLLALFLSLWALLIFGGPYLWIWVRGFQSNSVIRSNAAKEAKADCPSGDIVLRDGKSGLLALDYRCSPRGR